MRADGNWRSTSNWTTSCARRRESSSFCSIVPLVSVWPVTTMSLPLRACASASASDKVSCEDGVSVVPPSSKYTV